MQNLGLFRPLWAILLQIFVLFGVLLQANVMRWCAKINKFQVWWLKLRTYFNVIFSAVLPLLLMLVLNLYIIHDLRNIKVLLNISKNNNVINNEVSRSRGLARRRSWRRSWTCSWSCSTSSSPSSSYTRPGSLLTCKDAVRKITKCSILTLQVWVHHVRGGTGKSQV